MDVRGCFDLSMAQRYDYLLHPSIPISPPPDASIFYHLESWVAAPDAPSHTHYVSLMEELQRHVTTAAYKLAGGVDLVATSISKPVKQQAIPQAFVAKITKAFLDALYAFLDGLVHLASDESPAVSAAPGVAGELSAPGGRNPLELLDLRDTVSIVPRVMREAGTDCRSGHTVAAGHLELQLPDDVRHPEHDHAAGECLRDFGSGGAEYSHDGRTRAGQDPLRVIREAEGRGRHADPAEWYIGQRYGLVRNPAADR